MRFSRSLVFAGLAFVASSGASAEAAGFKVVAYPTVEVDSMERADLVRIFLRKQTRWPDGTGVVPVDQTSDSPVREAFSQDVHGKDARSVVAYWQRQIFSGRDMPPLTRASDDEVLDFVKRTPGAIGYVDAELPTDGVAVIAVE